MKGIIMCMLGVTLLACSVEAQFYGTGSAGAARNIYINGAMATGSIGYRSIYNILTEAQGGYIQNGFIAVLSLGAQINLFGEEDYETGVKPFHSQVLIGYMDIGTDLKEAQATGFMVTGRFCLKNLFVQVQHTPGIEFYSAGIKFNFRPKSYFP